jgi:5-methylcytosine-specific restriction endonuclease McrA
MPLTTEQTLDAYESGIEAAFDHDVHHKAMRACPFQAGSDEEREWLLGVEHARGDRHIKNRRLRQLRRRLAQEFGRHTDEEWLVICSEFDFRCVRCGCRPISLERDHIVPIYQRGTEAITNIQPLCKTCNTSKGPEDTDWVTFRRQHGFSERETPQVRRSESPRVA